MTVSLSVEQAQKSKNGYDARYLKDVVDAVVKAKRILCLTGAGISTSAGIPDFRSKNGLYELAASGSGRGSGSSAASNTKKTSSLSTASSSSSGSKLSGQDMFSASVWQTPESTQRFLRFISTLHNVSQAAQPTPTHTFLKTLKNKKKLLRCYTQNIDGLEERAGLQAVSSTASSSTPPTSSKGKGKSKVKFEGDVVHLHGKAGSVRCTVCPTTGQWTDEIDQAFSKGESVPCDECRGRWEHRYNTGRRTNVAVGGMRPDVTLYGEQGRDDIMISELQDADVKAKPDCLIVMGTSLKVHGFKNLVKDFAGEVAEHDGKVIYVNLTPANKEWESHFDYHIEATTDAFVTYLSAEWKKMRPQDWQTQTLITSSRSLTSTKPSISLASSKPKATAKPIDSASPKKPLAVKDINLLASQAFTAADNSKHTKQSPRAASPTDSEATLVDEAEKEAARVEDMDTTLDSLSAITESSTLGPLRNSIKSSPDPPTPPKGFFTKSKSLSRSLIDVTVPTSPRKAIANARKRKLAIASFDFDSEGYTTAVGDDVIEKEGEGDSDSDSDDDTVTVVSTMSTPPRKRNKTIELSPRKTRSSNTTTAMKAAMPSEAEAKELSNNNKKRVSLRESTIKRGVIQSRIVQAKREKEENKLRLAKARVEAEEKEREKKESARRNINDFIMQKKLKVEHPKTNLSRSRHVRTPSLEV